MFRTHHAVCLLVLTSVACADARRNNPPPPPDPYPAAFEAGRDEAEGAIALGNPVWLRMPGPGTGAAGQSGLDPETGLPWLVVFPYPSHRAAEGRVAGHNAALREYIQKYGVVPGSRAAWAGELSDISGYFARKSSETPPAELTLDGAAVISPDSSGAIAWRSAPGGDDGTSLLLVRDEQTRRLAPPVSPATVEKDGNVPSGKLLFGPEGSDLAFLQWPPPSAAQPDGARPTYSALDLRSGLWLRHEEPAAPR